MARTLLAVLCAGLISGPASLAAPQSQEKEIVHPSSGTWVEDLKDPETEKFLIRYKMRAPEKRPERKHLGLIVYFHGSGGNENSMYNFTVKPLEKMGVIDQYVVMGGKSRGVGWDKVDDPFVTKWIEWCMKTYPIDPRRVHIIGASNGGAMVKRYGWINQDMFATVTSYCGGGSGFMSATHPTKKLRPSRNPAEEKTEWYFVHGTEDVPVSVETSRRAAEQLKQKGYRYIYRELEGEDHGSISRVEPVKDDVFAWIHAVRHKEIVLNKDDRTAMSSLRSKIMRAGKDEAGAMIAEMSRIGGHWGGTPLAKAFKSMDEEVRTKATATTTTTLYGLRTVMELVKLTKNKSDAVKAEAYKGLAVASNWRYPQAQQFLIQVARSRSKKVEERIRAIEGLAKTVELMLLGNYEDKLVLWTLVLLLEDKEQAVREAAFAAFDGKKKETYNYKPDLGPADLKTSMRQWKSWAEKVAGPLHQAASGGR